MSNLREAAQQALEALEHAGQTGDWIFAGPAIKTLRAALAEPNPNPLGGPATRFRAVADRLDAGEPYAEVLADMGLADVAEPVQPVARVDRNTLIALAREAGADMYSSDRVEFWVPRLERFAALVAAHEREECARLMEAKADGVWANTCAAAIRSRT